MNVFHKDTGDIYFKVRRNVRENYCGFEGGFPGNERGR
jgi:hypothetical protein